MAQLDTADRFFRRTGLTAEDEALLARLPLFDGLSGDALRDLLADAWVQGFTRNASLFLQGDPAERFYVVLEGWVKLFRCTEQGEETVLAVFAAGESFAEAAIFDKAVYPVSATVVEDARLVVIPSGPFLRQFEAHSDYALKMMAAMSRHLHRLVTQVERLTLRSSTERLAEYLVKLCPRQSGPVVVDLPMGKALIAGRLGMQPETLSRSLAKLRSHGVVSNGMQVSIADVAALKDLCAGGVQFLPAAAAANGSRPARQMASHPG